MGFAGISALFEFGAGEFTAECAEAELGGSARDLTRRSALAGQARPYTEVDALVGEEQNGNEQKLEAAVDEVFQRVAT
jgi:hypothetical protein